MQKELRTKLEEMRQIFTSKPYEEIKEVGWEKLEPILFNNKKYEPSVWSELRPDNRVLLIVQLTKWYFLRVAGKTYCNGFLINLNNEIELVDENYLMEEIGHP